MRTILRAAAFGLAMLAGGAAQAAPVDPDGLPFAVTYVQTPVTPPLQPFAIGLGGAGVEADCGTGVLVGCGSDAVAFDFSVNAFSIVSSIANPSGSTSFATAGGPEPFNGYFLVLQLLSGDASGYQLNTVEQQLLSGSAVVSLQTAGTAFGVLIDLQGATFDASEGDFVTVSVSQIPLAGTLPLALAGIGALAVLRVRRRRITA